MVNHPIRHMRTRHLRNASLWGIALTCGLSVAHGGSVKTTRLLIAGLTSKRQLVTLGQEVVIRWGGKRKDPRWNDEDVRASRGRAVLRVAGEERKLRPVDPLEGEFVESSAFDGKRDRMVMIRRHKITEPSRCVVIDSEGRVATCRLPPNFYFDSMQGYLFQDGQTLRYAIMQNGQRAYAEIDLETGASRPISKAIATRPLRLQEPITSSIGKCVPDVLLSPDEKTLALVCDDSMVFSDDTAEKQVLLPGALPSISELTPLSSSDCLGRVDAVIVSAWEKIGFAWNHDSSQVYWCGKGRNTGYLVDRISGDVRKGPCLRAASWSADDSAIAGIVECGHEVKVWSP